MPASAPLGRRLTWDNAKVGALGREFAEQLSKTRRLQETFVVHLRHVARFYPSAENERFVLIIENAP